MGTDYLNERKVDNAVILAAGCCSRFQPFASYLPKGLAKVKGEVLIERIVRQLLDKGIGDITIVVGYMADKFNYLKDKFGAKIVFNPDYETYNNISSVYSIRNILKNTYILGSDNWYSDNIFNLYEYDSYFSRFYSKEFIDEYCVTLDEDKYITGINKGGQDTWYTLGEIYFTKDLSSKVRKDLDREYNSSSDVRNMIIDVFCQKHIDTYRFFTKERKLGQIYEFDSMEDVYEFDPAFRDYAQGVVKTEAENMKKVKKTMRPWFIPYEGVEKYTIHPTDEYRGRLQFNENIWGPSPKCLEVLSTIKTTDLNYYDLEAEDFLAKKLSQMVGVPENYIFLNNGSSEVLKAIFDIALQKDDCVLIPYPGWGCYKGMITAKLGHTATYNVVAGQDEYYHDIDDIIEKAKQLSPKIIILTSPQMPTGNRVTQEGVERVASANPDSLIIIDECYYGCAEMNLDVPSTIAKYDNVLFVRTLSKIYGLANLRIGFGITNPELVDLIDYVLPLHKLPNIIRKIAVAALEDVEYTEKNKQEIIQARDYLTLELNKRIGIKAYKSYSNFVYIRLEGYDANALHQFMSERGVTTRLFDDHGETHMRITVAPKEVLDKALTLLDEGCKIYKKL